MGRKLKPINRNKSKSIKERALESASEILSEGAAKASEEEAKDIASKNPPDSWTELDEWNKDHLRRTYSNHAAFLAAGLRAAHAPASLIEKAVPDDPQKRGDFELASAIQRGMFDVSYPNAEVLDAVLGWEGYSPSARKASVATYNAIKEPACWLLGTVLGWTGDPERFHPRFTT